MLAVGQDVQLLEARDVRLEPFRVLRQADRVLGAKTGKQAAHKLTAEAVDVANNWRLKLLKAVERLT